MGWYYDFYKIYKTKKEDVDLWSEKNVEELPSHLQFICDEFDNSDKHNQLEEIQGFVLPISMYIDDSVFNGYLATLYPVALFGSDVFEVAYKSPRNSWYHFVRLTNSHAKRMIRFAANVKCEYRSDIDKEEYIKGLLGKHNKYKHYPGKIRNVVFYQHQ